MKKITISNDGNITMDKLSQFEEEQTFNTLIDVFKSARKNFKTAIARINKLIND